MPRPGPQLALIAAAAACAASAGCGVRIEGGGAADAAVDARPCTGGDAAQASPSGACFFVFTAPATFAGARDACAAQGAHLAILRSAQDDQVAGALVGATGTAFIDLTDQATEGTFVWGDAMAPAYTNWYPAEPNDGGGNYREDCAVIVGARGGQWDDRPCAPVPDVGGGSYAYLCQRP